LIIWGVVIYAVLKALALFLRFFIPAVRSKENYKQKTSPQSKYKDAEEVDFIEIKSDKKDGKDQE
jgi:hypothetical protein